MLVGMQRFVNETFPFWAKNGGRDHVFLMPHDEGACYAPPDIWVRRWRKGRCRTAPALCL